MYAYIIYMYKCVCILYIRLTITDYSDGDYLRSYKHTGLQVEEMVSMLPRTEIMILQVTSENK